METKGYRWMGCTESGEGAKAEEGKARVGIAERGVREPGR